MKKLTEAQERFLNELPEKYGAALSKYAYRFFGYQRHMLPAAEDAVQETFIKAVSEVERLMTHPNPLGWLYTALRYVLLNMRRDMDRRREELYGSVADLPETSDPVIGYTMDRWGNTVSLPTVLEQMEQCLTRDERATFADHYLMGYSTEETAFRENVSADTVRGRLSRIRRKIRKAFSET
ncbi:MAG: RNA polymerase sigma factor [Clostridia bacterium]|nr:RNA polymerase sigma factor [Clostridia bacterium]